MTGPARCLPRGDVNQEQRVKAALDTPDGTPPAGPAAPLRTGFAVVSRLAARAGARPVAGSCLAAGVTAHTTCAVGVRFDSDGTSSTVLICAASRMPARP